VRAIVLVQNNGGRVGSANRQTPDVPGVLVEFFDRIEKLKDMIDFLVEKNGVEIIISVVGGRLFKIL
jgi:hypothetical protein